RPGAGPQARRGGSALHPHAQRDHRRTAGNRRPRARLAGARPGEAIAYDTSGRPHPFQVTMRRFGRRLEVERLRTELPVRAYFFDCLRVDDRSLADRPLRERSDALVAVTPDYTRVPRIITASATGRSLLRGCARGRSRRRHGKVPGRPLRGG